MSRAIFAGLFTEGSTDQRFLGSVVKRTFDNVAIECKGDIEIELFPIIITKTGLCFKDQVLEASKKGIDDYGIMILCIHTDADEETDERAFRTKIIPAIQELESMNGQNYCKVFSIIVPVQMVESWMLADTELFKREIGSLKTDFDLGIHRSPETIADPKSAVQNALRISVQDKSKRRRHELTISNLYLPIGQKIDLNRLRALPSYLKFEESVRAALRSLNFLQ